MKTIRTNCFETNSSSTHSITIDDSYVLKEDPKNRLVAPAEFGWEQSKSNSFDIKASYFWTIAQTDNYNWDLLGGSLKERMIRLASLHGFELSLESADSYCYVDHGAEHFEDMAERYPDLITDEGLYSFLVSESCWITTGNDNTHDAPNLRLTPNQIKAAQKFFVLDANEKYRYAIHASQDELFYATEAAHAYLDEQRAGEYTEWHEITPNNDGTIDIKVKKYNYKTNEYEIINTFTLTYHIEDSSSN